MVVSPVRFVRRFAPLAVVGLLLLPAVTHGQGGMTNGLNYTGDILLAGEIDTYSFTATAGDDLIVHIGETAGIADFTPWIRLFAPDNSMVGNASGVLAAQINVAAAQTGTYTVQVGSFDTGFDATGSYTLTLAKSPGAFSISPGDEGGALTNGANHTGHIHVGDVDMWSFDATAGDAIVLALGEVGADTAFQPWLRLRSPTGQNIGNTSGVLAAQLDIVAPATGTYTVVIGSFDTGFDATGDYTLTLTRTAGPYTVSPGDQGGPMTNGSNHTGHIHVGDLDTWTFDATAGDAIVLALGETGPINTPFQPWLRLKSPTGQNIGNTSGVLAAQLDIVAPVTGTYTVIVSTFDTGFDATGDYTLTLTKTTGPYTVDGGDEGGPMTNGANHTGHLFIGDLDTYTFTATAGDAIVLALGEVGPDTAYQPWLRLKSPTGANIGNTSGVLAAQLDIVAPATGLYTVVVSSFDTAFDAPGDYTLTLTKTAGPYTVSGGDEGGPMTNGSNHTGHIHVGDLDTWTFTATAGDAIVLALGEVGADSAFQPWLRLKSPTGQSLGNASGVLATQFDVVATVTGTYTVVVSTFDTGFDATGDYTLTLTRTAGPYTVTPGDEGGPMTNGSNYTGSIHVGDLDTYTFTAAAGDDIKLAIGEVGGNSAFQPWVRLKSPTGENLGNTSGVLAAQIDAQATVTGTYTVIVSTFDTGFDATGNYTLTLAKTPGAFTISPGDEGGSLTAGGSTTKTGFIHVGDLDLWSFVAHGGDPLNLTITETGSPSADFTPWIRLIGPSGQNVGGASGATTAQINVAAPITGTYHVIVSTFDTGLDGSGDYILSVSGIRDSIVCNGDFSLNENCWSFFATPTLPYIVHNVTNGVLNYYRVPPPAGTTNQAVAFQETGVAMPAFAPIRTQFDLANTSSVRKRISVLVLAHDFSDLSVCTFWLEPNAPMRTYVMRTHTNQAWTNTALYFYAASAGDNGGMYQIDNVSMAYVPEQAADRTDCVDPTTPAAPGGGAGPDLLVNGNFDTGSLAPWFTFGTITAQVNTGVLEMIKASSTAPAGVVSQQTAQPMTAGQILTATFQLGNSSPVRKRVTVLLHDTDFSDLSACTFWLLPGQPLSDFTYRTFTTKAWTNASVSIYPATVGAQQWIRVDNVTFQRTPATATVGTECIEPSGSSAAFAEAARNGPASAGADASDASAGGAPGVTSASDLREFTADPAGDKALSVDDAIDLREMSAATLKFSSWLAGTNTNALVQVSVDGVEWVTVGAAPESDRWTPVDIDLSSFAGEVIRVRFVLQSRTPFDDEGPSRWRIRQLRVEGR